MSAHTAWERREGLREGRWREAGGLREGRWREVEGREVEGSGREGRWREAGRKGRGKGGEDPAPPERTNSRCRLFLKFSNPLVAAMPDSSEQNSKCLDRSVLRTSLMMRDRTSRKSADVRFAKMLRKRELRTRKAEAMWCLSRTDASE